MSGQVRRRDLFAQVAGRLRRHGALAVPGRVVRRVGHRAADGQLVAGQRAVRRAHGHGEAEVRRHQARVGRGRGALGHPGGRKPQLRCEVRVVQPVAIGHRVTEGNGARRRRRRGGGGRRAPRRQDATGDQGRHDERGDRPEHGRAPRRGAPGLQPSHGRSSRVAAGRQRRRDLTGSDQSGGSRTRQPLCPPKPNELESTAAGSHACGAPCTTRIVISGSGSP